MKYTEEKQMERMEETDRRLGAGYRACRRRMVERIREDCQEEIYHYTSAEGFHNIISNQQFFLTDVAFLNDSTEMANVINTFEKTLNGMGHRLSAPFAERLSRLLAPADFDEMLFGNGYGEEETAAEDLRFFVLACSFQKDSLNLWNYYTSEDDREGGYNIAFHRQELTDSFSRLNEEFYGSDMLLSHGRIIYDEETKSSLISDYLLAVDRLWQETGRPGRDLLLSCIKSAVKWLSIFFKHECFASEEEYRIVLSLPNSRLTDYFARREKGPERLYKIRFTNNMFTPYVKLRFNVEEIRGVCLSPLCEKYTTEYRLQSVPDPEIGELRDVLQYGVHEFLRINGVPLSGGQVRRSAIPLRY